MRAGAFSLAFHRCSLLCASGSGAEQAAVVGFLVELGFQEVGRPRSLGSLEPLARSVAGHLCTVRPTLPTRARMHSQEALCKDIHMRGGPDAMAASGLLASF
jgi:hypothetical protein